MPQHQNSVRSRLNRRVTLFTWTTALFLCIIFQQLHPNWCYQDVRNYHKRFLQVQSQDASHLPRTPTTDSITADKRTLTSGSGIGGSVSQPEEIFSTNDQLESNYDEYPVSITV